MSEITNGRRSAGSSVYGRSMFNLKELIMGEMKDEGRIQSVPDYYGQNVFGLRTMRNYLAEKAFKSLSTTIKEGGRLDPSIADEVADAMKTWAVMIRPLSIPTLANL